MLHSGKFFSISEPSEITTLLYTFSGFCKFTSLILIFSSSAFSITLKVPSVSTMAYQTCDTSKISFLRSSSKRSSVVKRSSFSCFWSITPSRITISGFPCIAERNLTLFRLRIEIIISNPTSKSTGMIVFISGRLVSCMGIARISDKSIVITSSAG